MPIAHLFLVLLVVIIWGCNFVFIKFGLNEMHPLLLCAARFLLAFFPAIFFMKRPAIPFKIIIYYGLFTFALQFSLLFWGMHVGIAPGLASLLMQVQVFFSIFFAILFLGETPTRWQVLGALVSFVGIGLVAIHLDNHLSLLGFVLIMAAAASWGFGNLITKKITKINMLALVVWGSFVAFFPLLLLSLLLEGTDSIVYSFHHLSGLGIFSVIYIAYGSTWIGYGIWNWLLSQHSVAAVAPFTLLVPIVGILSSAFILGEPLQSWKLIAGLLVMTGLCVNLLGATLAARKKIQSSFKALNQANSK